MLHDRVYYQKSQHHHRYFTIGSFTSNHPSCSTLTPLTSFPLAYIVRTLYFSPLDQRSWTDKNRWKANRWRKICEVFLGMLRENRGTLQFKLPILPLLHILRPFALTYSFKKHEVSPGYFRFLTVMAMKVFQEENVDAVILEVPASQPTTTTNSLCSGWYWWANWFNELFGLCCRYWNHNAWLWSHGSSRRYTCKNCRRKGGYNEGL